MREEAGRSFAELNIVADKAKDTVQAYFKYTQIHRTEVLDLLGPLAADIIGYIARWIKRDPFQIIHSNFQPDSDVILERPAFLLLSRHPILCGLMTYRLNLLTREFGQYLSWASRTLVSAAHLYNAVRQRKLCQSWPDMDALISIYGEEKIFLGALPTKPADFSSKCIYRLDVFFPDVLINFSQAHFQ